MKALRMPGFLQPVELCWAMTGALSLWLGFPNDFISLPPLVMLWPLALAVLGSNAYSHVAAFRKGWLVTWAGSAAALYWLVLPVHDVGGLPIPLAVPCALLIAACLASAGGFFSMAARLLQGFPTLLTVIILALVWYLLEWSYALIVGFPWLPLAGALAVWPVMVQAADIAGAYGLGALWLVAALLCLTALPGRMTGRISDRMDLPTLCAGSFLTLALISYGWWRLDSHPLETAPKGSDSMAALFVEGNVDQNQKWLPAFQRQNVELYADLTHMGLAASQDILQPGPALIIWPETALPFFYEQNPILSNLVRQVAQKADLPILFGAPGIEYRTDLSEPKIYNRAFLLDPDGSLVAYYDKEHLVPFGEYLPTWLEWDFLEALLQGVGVYSQGTTTKPLFYDDLALGVLICYEAIFPWLAQERVANGANILLDISNDGWFGYSPAARQHLYLTALRALEQNRWILRGTNTGISAVVDARGRLVIHGTQFCAGSLAARARLYTDPSTYHYLAPWLPGLAFLLCCGLLWLGRCKIRSYPQPK